MKLIFHPVSPDKTDNYTDCIPEDSLDILGQENTLLFGFDSPEGEACGAALFSVGAAISGELGKNLVLESYYVKPAYRNPKVFPEFLNTVFANLDEYRISGIIAKTLHPQMSRNEYYLEDSGFIRLKDGNTIYRLRTKDFYDIRLVPEEKRQSKASRISSFSDYSSSQLSVFLQSAGEKYPKSLSVASLPGEWSRQFSYSYSSKGKLGGFLLTSFWEEGSIYLGSLYADKNHPAAAALLIDRLISDLAHEPQLKTITFAASSKAGLAIAEHMIDKAKTTPEISTVRNYYKQA